MEEKKYVAEGAYKRETILSLIPLFMEEIESDLAGLTLSIEQNDWEEFKKKIHKIKGVARCYGAQYILKEATAIHDTITQQEQLIGLDIASLKQEITEFKQAADKNLIH